MTKAKSYIPEGLRTVTAHIVVKNALSAIEFYKKAFGAELLSHAPGPAPGSTMHASIRIGDATVFLVDDMNMSVVKAPSSLGGTTSSLMLFVPDCDAVFNRAVAAGAQVFGGQMGAMADQFWGDRAGTVTDPHGYTWTIATHKEDLAPEEIKTRMDAFMKNASAQPAHR
jgi:PhnB protein